MVERARRHEIDDRRAVCVDAINPSACDGTAEEDRHQPLDRSRRARQRLAVSCFGCADLGLDRFGMRPAAAGGFVHAPVVEQFVNNESLRIEAVPIAERLQRPGDRRIAPSREAGIAAKQPRPLEMMSWLAYASGESRARVPGAVKIFGKDSGLRL